MKNLIKASVAMAAFAALLVVPSAASALTLTAPTGTALAAGAALEGTNVAHDKHLQPTLMTTPIGTVSCATSTISGPVHAVTANHILVEITTADYSGDPKKPLQHGAHCESPLGKVTVTPNHTSDAVGSLNWCLTLDKQDKFQVWGKPVGGSCTSGTRPLIFALHTELAGQCTYSRASLEGTYTTHPVDAIATVNAGQTFTKTGGGGFCPASGTLDMAFTVKGPAGATAYVD